MKLKSVICLLILFVLSICSCFAKNIKTLEHLIKYSDSGEYGKAAKLFNKLTDKEKNQLADLMESNSHPIEPFYFIALADHVYQKDKDKAVFFYYVGRLRATQDVMLCEDTTARSQISIYPLMARNTMEYASKKFKNPDYINNVFQKALDWDANNSERVSPIWSCYHGIGAFTHQPQLVNENQFKETREEVRRYFLDTMTKTK